MKPTFRHTLVFTWMFTACLAGSVAIFMFAVGMETGNKIINQAMAALIEHAFVVESERAAIKRHHLALSDDY